jgi:hypothetical protein
MTNERDKTNDTDRNARVPAVAGIPRAGKGRGTNIKFGIKGPHLVERIVELRPDENSFLDTVNDSGPLTWLFYYASDEELENAGFDPDKVQEWWQDISEGSSPEGKFPEFVAQTTEQITNYLGKDFFEDFLKE